MERLQFLDLSGLPDKRAGDSEVSELANHFAAFHDKIH